MLKSYFTIAFRNLVKSKLHSFINIAGLSVGMAVAILIGLWVWDEVSFDTGHTNYDRIGVVALNETVMGEVRTTTNVPYPLAGVLESDYRERLGRIVAANQPWESVLTIGEKKLAVMGQFMQSGGPELFTLKMLRGSRDGLDAPGSILLAASTAKAFFGDSDPIGQSVKIDDADSSQVIVTGVYADLPSNSSLASLKFISSWDWFLANNPFMKKKGWDNHAIRIYVKILPGATFEQTGSGIRNAEFAVVQHLAGMKLEAATHPQLWLHPMRDWHLYSNFRNGVAQSDAVGFVRLVGLIGGIVLLLACINFMNLSTARSERRAKEVGIRKTIGSERWQLIFQFFCESYAVVVLAFLLAIVLTVLALPWFNGLAAKDLHMPWANPWFWVAGFCFMFLTGLLAGSYPALYLSSFRPVHVLKGIFRAGRLAVVPRKVLVVLQFTVSVVLIICTIVVYNQIRYAKDRPVGYSRDGLILMKIRSAEYFAKYGVLRNELKNTGVVAEMAESQSPVTGVFSHSNGFMWKDKSPAIHEDFATLNVSPEYGNTVGWQFIAGRNFLPGYSSDSSGFVINESAAKFMGLQHPVGEVVRWTSKWANFDKNFIVLGVVKDMIMESPFEPARPTVFWLGGSYNWFNIKINPGANAHRALSKIEGVFRRVTPTVPFDYVFADQDYARKFASEERIGRLARLFAILAIFISCLGLFGMSAFMAEQRTKEIGLRKVLGASVVNLLALLSGDFIRMVGLSLLIALPIAAYLMGRWLGHYAYHTPLSWWIFVVTALGTFGITLLTVGFQSARAALMNPARSLRAE
ncbi:MAG TPA: FtsX-like permease family protein [Puia sp.]|jgi:hypothetical protein